MWGLVITPGHSRAGDPGQRLEGADVLGGADSAVLQGFYERLGIVRMWHARRFVGRSALPSGRSMPSVDTKEVREDGPVRRPDLRPQDVRGLSVQQALIDLAHQGFDAEIVAAVADYPGLLCG